MVGIASRSPERGRGENRVEGMRWPCRRRHGGRPVSSATQNAFTASEAKDAGSRRKQAPGGMLASPVQVPKWNPMGKAVGTEGPIVPFDSKLHLVLSEQGPHHHLRRTSACLPRPFHPAFPGTCKQRPINVKNRTTESPSGGCRSKNSPLIGFPLPLSAPVEHIPPERAVLEPDVGPLWGANSKPGGPPWRRPTPWSPPRLASAGDVMAPAREDGLILV